MFEANIFSRKIPEHSPLFQRFPSQQINGMMPIFIRYESNSKIFQLLKEIYMKLGNIFQANKISVKP